MRPQGVPGLRRLETSWVPGVAVTVAVRTLPALTVHSDFAGG